MSAKIDADRATNMADWAAAKEKGGGENGGDAGSGAVAAEGGADNGDSGTSSTAGDMSSPGGAPAAPDAANAVGADTGGDFDWGGSISGGGNDAVADEWQKALDSYDPSKIGLPDDK